MAVVPTYRTWVTGEIVTAAFLNSNVRDAGLYLLDQQAQTQNLSYLPGSNQDTPGAGSATWFTAGNVVVPSWANTARFQMNITGVIPTVTGNNVTFTVKLGAIGSQITGRRILDHGSAAGRFTLAYTDYVVNPTAGSQAVSVACAYVAGTGVYRLDTVSYVNFLFQFYP